MPIEEFNQVFRPVVNPVNLDVAGKAYDTLEQGHLKAIDTASAVQAELAKLDLNEAEDEWRQQQVNKIRSAVTDNSTYSNAYGALDDVIRENGAIMSNPGMIGRLRAQQDYKKYIDNLDKRTDIPEDYKAYYKEMNKYNYKDVTDDKGNIIGGSKWQPTDQEVSTVPMNQILDQALKWAAKESGGGSQTRWLDAQGRVTDDITKSVTGEIYSASSNKWERLTKDKLAAAVSAVIENTPGAKASLEQDYKIAKWKYDKSGGNNPDITDKDGILLTPEQYLTKRIDPFYKAATYYNQTSDTKYGEAWKAQLALANKQAAGGGQYGNPRGADILSTTTNPVRIENFVPSKAQADITSSKQSLANLLKGANPNLEFNLDGQTNDAIKKLITDNITDPMEKLRALQNLETIQDNQEYLNTLKAGQDPDIANAFDTYNAIVSMSDLPSVENNKYAKDYATRVNNLYGSNGQAIRQYFADDDIYDEFIANVGGEKKAEALGIKFGSKDGKKYVELPRDNNRSLYSFAKASTDAINKRSLVGEIWQLGKGLVNSKWGDNVVRIGANGEEEPVTEAQSYQGTAWLTSTSRSSQGDNVFEGLIRKVDSMKKKNDEMLKGGMLQLGQSVITQPSANAAELAFMMKANPEAAGKLSTAYKLETDEAMAAIQGIDLTQTGALVVGDNNMFENVSSEDRKILTARLRSAKPQDISVMAVQDPQTGQWSPQITIRGEYEGDKEKHAPVTLYAPGGFNSAAVESWNRDTTFKAKNDVNVYGAAGRNINLTNASAFANIDKVTMVPVGNGFEVVNKTDNKSLGTVSNETAVDLRDAYYKWNDIFNAVQAGVQVQPKAISAIAEQTAHTLAEITGSGNNESIVAYYYQQLINNITGK